MLLADFRTELQTEIQTQIKKTMSDVSNRQKKTTPKDTSDTFQAEKLDEIFQVDENFHSFLSTIVLFIEQEPFSNVPMNLDVNFRHVNQENYAQENGRDMKEAIFEENRDTFQNNAIHLLFYEKIIRTKPSNDLLPSLDKTPTLSSMSWCRLKKNLELMLLMKHLR